jgi:predicted component of viral defense system (DUF524 family)
MIVLTEHDVAFRASSGAVVAYVRLTPAKDAVNVVTAPLIQLDEAEALEYGETAVQLRESERYEYQVFPLGGADAKDLRLRCSLSSRRKSLGRDGRPDAGLLETKIFCGTLLLELVEGSIDNEKRAVASAVVEVRSLKLDYRTEYRGMLRRLAAEIADLVVDARSSVKVAFHSSFEERRQEGWLQLQLELLREILDSPSFAAAMQRITAYPHETLSTISETASADRPIRWVPSALRQLVSNNPRRAISADHPLRTVSGLETVADRVFVSRRFREFDTPENRFIKFVLGEFRSFLTHAQRVFESTNGWEVSGAVARRLSAKVDNWISGPFFVGIGPVRLAPFGSPVLQRKAGYREILRWWLRFKTAAELSWEGGEGLFKAGQRDVASLYEYWIFFELMNWFCQVCRAGKRPAIEELVDGLGDGSPNLRLRKRVELGPFEGAIVVGSRTLNARFSYNKRFGVVTERSKRGSWTRALHPDYTLTFWPAEVSEAEAEREELLAHIHLDAKYRVENIEAVFDSETREDIDDETAGNYKHQDLLKMHAYKDAIQRTQGAYILYPGGEVKPIKFSGFHEILPGLGAFGVSPDEFGRAQGMEELSSFLEEVVIHLGNRTSARERAGYHLAQAYRKKIPVPSALPDALPEWDLMEAGSIALPPDEHLVLVVTRCSDTSLAWMRENAMGVVRLSQGGREWRVQTEWSGLRHLIFHTSGSSTVRGLWRIVKPGYRVLSGAELAEIGFPGTRKPDVYGVFDISSSLDMSAVTWNVRALVKAIREYECSKKRTLAKVVGNRFTAPRLVTLAGLSSSWSRSQPLFP